MHIPVFREEDFIVAHMNDSLWVAGPSISSDGHALIGRTFTFNTNVSSEQIPGGGCTTTTPSMFTMSK